MAGYTGTNGPDRGMEAEDRNESPNGVGTPGGAKGGAWGRPDSKPLGGILDTSQVGTKPWLKGGRSK